MWLPPSPVAPPRFACSRRTISTDRSRQLFEHFAWEPAFLDAVATRPLPAEVLMALRAGKSQHAALDACHQVSLCLFCHTVSGREKELITFATATSFLFMPLLRYLCLSLLPPLPPHTPRTHCGAN